MATKIIGKVSIVPYGDWQASTTYPRLAVVSYQGGSYIALADNTNIVPTNDSVWNLLTAPGRGIQQIEKIGTVGLVDTYRITYTDGTHFDYTVNNGASKTSELTNDAGFITNQVNNLVNYLLAVDTGAYIELLYDSEGYTITANLKNSSGATISTSTLQLPSGSSVVDASYDEETYIITLTQRDGTTIALDLSNSFNAKEDITNKTDELNGNSTENEYPNAQITYEKIHELQEQGVSQEAQGQEIFLYDATNLPPKDFALLGNAAQETNILTYKCDGTETGDYYFTYDNTNYQFTMPTISAGELLTFNTTTLKLYQNATEITTTSASTGTLITLSSTPSPDYSVPIKVVTGDNTVKVVNKNILLMENEAKTWRTNTWSFSKGLLTFNNTNGANSNNLLGNKIANVIIPAGTKITLSMKYISGSLDTESANQYFRFGIRVLFDDNTTSDILMPTSSGYTYANYKTAGTLTHTTSALSKKVVGIYIKPNTGYFAATNFTCQVQVEIGENATDWVEPTAQTQLLSLGSIELAKIGDYADRIYKQDGKWWLEKKIGKTILNGTESWSVDTQNLLFGTNFSRYSTGGMLLNYYTFVSTLSAARQIANGAAFYNGKIYLNNHGITNIDDFIAWLSNNNVTVYYVLATPVTTEITDETLLAQLNKLEAISLLKGYTYIYTEIASSNVNPYIKLVYIKDLNVIVDELQSFNELLLDQVPTQQVSGNLINVQDSSNLPLKDFEMQGNATQDTNILTYKCDGTETGDYYFTYDNTNYQFTMPTISAGELLTFNTTTLKLYQNATEITTTSASTGTLITLSSTPSPDYSVPIKVVTGDNTVKVIGKNLYNATKEETISGEVTYSADEECLNINGSGSGRQLRFLYNNLPKGKYRLMLELIDGSIVSTSTGAIFYLNVNSTNGTSIFISNTNKQATLIRELTKDVNSVHIYCYTRSSETFTNSKIKYQLIFEPESGGTPDYNFEAYQGQQATLSLGNIELAKIGDYADRIYKQDGKWWLEKKIKEKTLVGTETITVVAQPTGKTVFLYNSIRSECVGINSEVSILCDHFLGSPDNAGNVLNTCRINANGQVFFVTSDTFISADDFKEWLTNNNTTFNYRLRTPTITEITDTTLIGQLENVLKMQTYKTISNIFAINDGATPTLEIEYRQDLQTLIDKITSLEARVALLE